MYSNSSNRTQAGRAGWSIKHSRSTDSGTPRDSAHSRGVPHIIGISVTPLVWFSFAAIMTSLPRPLDSDLQGTCQEGEEIPPMRLGGANRMALTLLFSDWMELADSLSPRHAAAGVFVPRMVRASRRSCTTTAGGTAVLLLPHACP